MSKFLTITLTAAALALTSPVLAAGDRDQQSGKQSSSQHSSSQQSNLQGWRGKQLIGATVRGPNGDEYGTVKDLIVSNDGQLQNLLVSAGGVLGIGDTQVVVPYKQAKITNDLKAVTLPMTKEEITKGASAKGQNITQGTDTFLVSKIEDKDVRLQGDQKYGTLDSLVFDRNGKVASALVEPSGGNRGQYKMVPWQSAKVNADQGYITLPMTQDQVAALSDVQPDSIKSPFD